ncbi:MAG: response regulator [Nannocystaceae bacterium]
MSKILVVDDEPISRKIVSKIAQTLGHTTVHASDGMRAWTTLEDNPDIALVCTDFEMPQLDGRELTRKIRSNRQHAELPIVMISGVILPHELCALLSLGVDRFLPKPIDQGQLRGYLERFLPPLHRRANLRHAA